MAKLFIFGIGGTGSRVIKSLTMLLASGVSINADKIIPIIIDPDTQNGDMLRTVELLKLYQSIHSKLKSKNGFFSQTISTLSSLKSDNTDKGISSSFTLDLQNTLGIPFKSFIDFNNIQTTETKWLLNLLYSAKNMNDPLTKGFLGNPNVGSVVLNHIKDSEDFKFFGSIFSPGDRIFIISSIFGGTGAAGFPLLLKNFRDPNAALGSIDAINNSIIGAVSIHPYFKIQPDENCAVDSNGFITKAKAALTYYQKLNNLNALYYLGDSLDRSRSYHPHDGGTDQKNDAHFIELIASLAILDFANKTDNNFPINNPHYFEYSIDKNENIVFNSMCESSRIYFEKNLAQFFFFSKLNSDYVQSSKLDQVWAKANKIDKEFLSSDFYRNLSDFMQKYFDQWLFELKRNERSFAPFNLDTGIEDLTNSISDRTLKRRRALFFHGLDYSHFDFELNLSSSNGMTNSQKFIDIWWNATHNIVTSKFS